MSKILEKNSVGVVLKEYWKRFVGLVIASKNKLSDPLIKSEFNVIFLQIIFVIVLLLITYVFFTYLYEDILRTVVDSIVQGLSSGNVPQGENIVSSLQIIKAKNFIFFSTILVLLTAVFIYLVAKMTMRPAKNALNSQKRFISDIAHELRTPLAVIKTNNEVALMGHVDGPMREIIESNIEELDRMSDIINNVLSFNQLVRPERIKFTNVNMGPIIDGAVEKLRQFSEKKHLEIVVKKVSPHIVWGNAVALEQIVINLLKNAVAYTPPNGRITVRVGPDYYGNILFHISDTGIGITKKDLMHIFEPFYRAEQSRNRKIGSSGLGLTIVSELVKMHSGRITVKSAENKGTTAVVTLPYGKKTEKEEDIDLSKLNEISIDFLQDKM